MIYVLLADGFEDIEALEPIDILRRAEIDVKTVAVTGNGAISAHGIPVTADIKIDEIDCTDMTMLVLPGGAGHTVLDASEKVQSLIDFAYQNNIYIAAICASPSILGKKSLLNGKNYTCFPGFEQYAKGGNLLSDKAVLDGLILTGKGAGAASDFGFKMVEIFKGKELADKIKAQMQY